MNELSSYGEFALREGPQYEEIWSGMVIDAIDLVSDQDQITWITEGGKRIAAIVPVDVAERGEISA